MVVSITPIEPNNAAREVFETGEVEVLVGRVTTVWADIDVSALAPGSEGVFKVEWTGPDGSRTEALSGGFEISGNPDVATARGGDAPRALARPV